jgi:hypothetical protein
MHHEMQNESAREAIERLEDEIERLSVRRARCAKLSLAAKTAIGLGALWLGLTLVSLAPFTPALVFAALAAVIGGVVLLGSNATTWEQTDAALRAADEARARLIEGVQMRVVDEGVRQLH